jgi:hypothetical protein
MKLYINFFPEDQVRKKFANLQRVNFSFFQDFRPTSAEQLSKINIFSHQEPNEYFGHHDWVINNHRLFSLILTWSDKVLNNCPNAIFQPFGSTWLSEIQYKSMFPKDKQFVISHIRGNLLIAHGHQIRYEMHDRSSEILHPIRFRLTAGIREKPETCAIAKMELFADAQYGIVIENTSRRGYFTEKIMEMFLLRTIPIYWGCSNIGDFFDADGIIPVSNVDDAIKKINSLDANYYASKADSVEANYNTALIYMDYLANISNTLENIFRINGLLPDDHSD